MRLIDADALFMEKVRTMLEPLGNGQYEEVEIVYFRDIENAPTIDPFKDKSLEQLMDYAFTRGYYKGRDVFNPVRHGRWIDTDRDDPCYYYCSECHRQVDMRENYCPTCGARMDDGDENETD